MALTRNKMASQHSFAMVPRSDIPRSRYMLQQSNKLTFNGGDLIPIYCEEMLPGDQFNGDTSIFARMATPITPVMDNAELETFFFFVPNRLTWDNWEEFIAGGDFTVPTITAPEGGFECQTIYDYFGLPCQGPPATFEEQIEVSALPLRGYYLIYKDWFRDQNMTPNFDIQTDDGPDAPTDYTILKRNKKHDYFTSCLPWPQKGTAVSLPLGTSAPVVPLIPGSSTPTFRAAGAVPETVGLLRDTASNRATWTQDGATPYTPTVGGWAIWNQTGLIADLSEATSATINAIREAFQVQRLLERDARGGTRYTELIQSHFGVRPPDFRLQRPEYIGGGRTIINTHPVAQTSQTENQDTPLGNLAAFSTAHGGGHRFSYSATEHGYIIGLVNVRTDISYQQGLRRHWSRQTRYDFYFPVFAHLGEQAVLNKELQAGFTTDNNVFGYQERWAEYRYTPNQICGLFRSLAAGTIDVWHYALDIDFPFALNQAFITDSSQQALARSMAVGTGANGQQIIMDCLHRVSATRPMPTYSVPGLIDHF